MEEIFRFTYIGSPKPADPNSVFRLPIVDTRISAALFNTQRDREAIRTTANEVVVSFGQATSNSRFFLLLDIRQRLLAASTNGNFDPVAISEQIIGGTLDEWLADPSWTAFQNELIELVAARKFIKGNQPRDFQQVYDALLTLDVLKQLPFADFSDSAAQLRKLLNRQVSLAYPLLTKGQSNDNSTDESDKPLVANLVQLQLRKKRIAQVQEDLANLKREDTIAMEAKLDDQGHRILVPKHACSEPVERSKSNLFIHEHALARLPQNTREFLTDNELSAEALPVSDIMYRLEDLQRWTDREISERTSSPLSFVNMLYVGASAMPNPNFLPDFELDVIAPDMPKVPSTSGLVTPLGIGRLMVTMQHLTRYEGGDLAHVENVLLSELKTRKTRRMERVEDIFTQEEESSREELWDTQTTQRNEIQSEVQKVLADSESFNIGGKISGGYGPFVQAEISTGYETNSSQETTSRNAANFAREVMEKSSVKVAQRTKELRTITTVYEFEEQNEHTFNNVDGEDHISGQFQWLNKVYQAQVYDYGVRIFFDIMVPEPATFYKQVMEFSAKPKFKLTPPSIFDQRFSQINTSNYKTYAQEYGLTGLSLPPPETKMIYESFQGHAQEGDGWIALNKKIPIPDNYTASSYNLILYVAPSSSTEDLYVMDNLSVQVGNHTETHPPVAFQADNITTLEGRKNTYVVHGEINSGDKLVGDLPVNIMINGAVQIQVNINIECNNDRAYDQWQLDTWEKLLQGYNVKKQQYDNKLAELTSQEGIVIEGNNPLENKRIQEDELKRAAISIITGQYFELFSAILQSDHMEGRVDFDEALAEGNYAKFFEEALDWERMLYEFFPYYWARRSTWVEKMLTQDADPQFASFLKASFAKLRIAVKPDYEHVLLHFLETGNIWSGGDLPPVHNEEYIALMAELSERRSEELNYERIAIGEPFEIKLPTTLVRLRPGNVLPTWSRNEQGEWVEDENNG